MTFDNRMPHTMKEGRRKVPLLGMDVVRLKQHGRLEDHEGRALLANHRHELM